MFTPRLSSVLGYCIVGFVAMSLQAAGAEPMTAPAILQELRSFRTMGAVLHVAAHPDDENRPLLAYLSKGRNYRTAYLSITRGDGGQNEIGPEFGEKLGAARTQELLAGRRFDGATQFFTRALDFGYSKSMDETLAIWDRQQVLSDVVRVIRTFRPDVIVTRFAPVAQPGNHGHHNASAVLALEAFKVAGDPKAFPEQFADGLTPWQPTRIVQNGGGSSFTLQAGGTDAVSGETFQAISARVSAQHKTQFGSDAGAVAGGRGGGGGGGGWTENFLLLDGTPGSGDLMTGINTTWSRVPGGAEVDRLVEDIVTQFKADDPSASVPALLALRSKVTALGADPVVEEKRQQLDRIILGCAGVMIATSAPAVEIVPGEALKLHYTASKRSTIPVRLLEVRVPDLGGSKPAADLGWGPGISGDLALTVPKGTPLTQPYWLREEAGPGMFRVAETKLIGQAENAPPFIAEYVLALGGQTLVIPNEPLAGGEAGALGRRLAVISPVALRFGSGVALLAPGAKKTVEVEITAERANAAGTVRLEVPPGWTAAPASQSFRLAQIGEKTRSTFTLTAPARAASGSVLAVAEVEGARFSNQRDEIRYDHIPTQVLQPPARLKVAAFDFAIRGRNVGYLPGSGDDTVSCLQQLGYTVTTLSGADLTTEKLRGLDAVVIGVRAFNQRTDFAANLPGLLAYAENGGTVIAQYNRPNGLRTQQLGPYPLSIQGQAPPLRVTNENAPVTFLLPAHPALTTPNKITAADFSGWVQERGAYFASTWDAEHYAAPLAMSDPGETEPNSSLLIAPYGKGFYVYTSLAFFRQLPAGVPGAYRLFANLVSLGK